VQALGQRLHRYNDSTPNVRAPMAA
jgi:hypothetical protein